MQPIVVVGCFLVLDAARKGRVRVFLTNQINSCKKVKRVRPCCFERWTHDQPETADLVSETSWISYWYGTMCAEEFGTSERRNGKYLVGVNNNIAVASS